VKIHIVLVEPEIPQNTGNISRTCAAVGAALHLVRPLGFSLDSRHLKRAGLDYWDRLELYMHDDLEEILSHDSGRNFFFATTKAAQDYSRIKYPDEVYLVFGKETQGLDEDLLYKNKERCIRIPMREDIRSLNLSNSVAVVVYEALRQNGFTGLETKGRLRSYEW
jgi:tRNA (cytidine/uridine-2'-O-)-methyltransferase